MQDLQNRLCDMHKFNFFFLKQTLNYLICRYAIKKTTPDWDCGFDCLIGIIILELYVLDLVLKTNMFSNVNI